MGGGEAVRRRAVGDGCYSCGAEGMLWRHGDIGLDSALICTGSQVLVGRKLREHVERNTVIEEFRDNVD